MSATDYAPLIQALALLVTSVVIPWGIYEFRRRTGVTVTDQERSAVYNSLQTGAGIIQTMLDQGKLKAADVTETNPVVLRVAERSLARVPDAAAAQATTAAGGAEIIVGRVNTSPQPVAVSGAVLSAASTR